MSEQTATLERVSTTALTVERRAAVRYGCDLDGQCRRLTTGEKDFWEGRF